jgi:hypothetical protein
MEKHDDSDVGRWTDERMARLAPDADSEPNVARGLARLRGRGEMLRPSRRRAWVAAAGMATVAIVSATPMARTIAERCGDLLGA